MKILPLISLSRYNFYKSSNENKNYFTLPQNNYVDTFEKTSAPSFGIIRSASNFRNLATRKTIHCIYCNGPLFSEKILNKLKSTGVFSSPIIDYVSNVFPYLEYFRKSEKEVFKVRTKIFKISRARPGR